MNRLEKNREPEVVFVSEKKQKEYPHRPAKTTNISTLKSTLQCGKIDKDNLKKNTQED